MAKTKEEARQQAKELFDNEMARQAERLIKNQRSVYGSPTKLKGLGISKPASSAANTILTTLMQQAAATGKKQLFEAIQEMAKNAGNIAAPAITKPADPILPGSPRRTQNDTTLDSNFTAARRIRLSQKLFSPKPAEEAQTFTSNASPLPSLQM